MRLNFTKTFLLSGKTIILIVFMLNSFGLPLYACEDNHQTSEVSHCHTTQNKVSTDVAAEQYKSIADCFFCENNACITAPAITSNANVEFQHIALLNLVSYDTFSVFKAKLHTTTQYIAPPLIVKNWQATYSIFLI